MNSFNDIAYLKTVTDHTELSESAAEVAFVGRSNVGKSSLLNAVCGKKNLARTSQVPGKTRTINVFAVKPGRWIVDLPGYGFAVGPAEEKEKWRFMIEGYLLGRPSLRAVFMLVDAKVGPTKLDRQMSLWLQDNGIPFCIVANKCDKVKSAAQQERRKEVARELELDTAFVRWVSAEKGFGVAELRREVAEALEIR